MENLKKELKSANQTIGKLVNFNHVVSCNLKEHVANFSLLLNFLGEESKEKILSILKIGNNNLTDTVKGLQEIVTISTNEKVKKESLVLNDFIYEAEQGLSGLIKKENAKIINEIDDDVCVSLPPVYLESILTNCLSNAVKI